MKPDWEMGLTINERFIISASWWTDQSAVCQFQQADQETPKQGCVESITIQKGKYVDRQKHFWRLFPVVFPDCIALRHSMNDKNQSGSTMAWGSSVPIHQSLNPFNNSWIRIPITRVILYPTPQFTNIKLEPTFMTANPAPRSIHHAPAGDYHRNDIPKQEWWCTGYHSTRLQRMWHRAVPQAAASYNAPLNKWWTVSLYAAADTTTCTKALWTMNSENEFQYPPPISTTSSSLQNLGSRI